MSDDKKQPNGCGLATGILLILFGLLLAFGGAMLSFDGIHGIINPDSSSRTVESAENPLFKVEFKLVPLED